MFQLRTSPLLYFPSAPRIRRQEDSSQRRRKIPCEARGGGNSTPREVTLIEVQSTPVEFRPTTGTSVFLWGIIGVQSLALVGAFVGGFLARTRRKKLEYLTVKVREINSELRKQRELDLHVCEADANAEAMRSYRAALEVALDAPSAAHPIEAYGPGQQSIAGARREFSRSLQDSRECLRKGEKSEAHYLCKNALFLAKEMADLRAQRSAHKLQSQIHQAAKEPTKALSSLKICLQLSDQLNDHSGDIDVLGDIGDIYANLGDYERAGKFYDLCCKVIQEDDYSENLSPYWDC